MTGTFIFLNALIFFHLCSCTSAFVLYPFYISFPNKIFLLFLNSTLFCNMKLFLTLNAYSHNLISHSYKEGFVFNIQLSFLKAFLELLSSVSFVYFEGIQSLAEKLLVGKKVQLLRFVSFCNKPFSELLNFAIFIPI